MKGRSWEDVGRAAFPGESDEGNENEVGMSLRDWFAGMALQRIIEDDIDGTPYADSVDSAARDAYRYADAMLKERER